MKVFATLLSDDLIKCGISVAKTPIRSFRFVFEQFSNLFRNATKTEKILLCHSNNNIFTAKSKE